MQLKNRDSQDQNHNPNVSMEQSRKASKPAQEDEAQPSEVKPPNKADADRAGQEPAAAH